MPPDNSPVTESPDKPTVAPKNDAPGTYISDSTIEIVIGNGASDLASLRSRTTDYWSIGIIALIMVGLAAYALLARPGFI